MGEPPWCSHAAGDLALVNIQSESASAEFSFSTPSAPPSTYTFKLIGSCDSEGGQTRPRRWRVNLLFAFERETNVCWIIDLNPLIRTVAPNLTPRAVVRIGLQAYSS